MHRAGLVQQAVETTKTLPGWSSFEKILDLGGSSGLYTVGLVSVHPKMKRIVFDRPAVVKVAERVIKEYGLSERIQVMGGSYVEGPLGSDYDLIWASDCLNFARGQLQKPIKLIYEALKPGGVFVSNHFHISRDRTNPLNQVFMAAWHWLAGKEMYFYEDQIPQAMLDAGFERIYTKPFELVLGLDHLDIGHKAK